MHNTPHCEIIATEANEKLANTSRLSARIRSHSELLVQNTNNVPNCKVAEWGLHNSLEFYILSIHVLGVTGSKPI